MTNFRYPTPEQVSALEHAARRARAEEIALLAKRAAAGVKSLFGRTATPVPLKGPRHA